MTSIQPPIITGEVVPGVIDPNIHRSFFTNKIMGLPIKEPTVESTPMPASGTKPRPTGDERDMVSVLQKVMQQQQQGGGGAPGGPPQQQQQQQAPIAQSLPGFRDWRN